MNFLPPEIEVPTESFGAIGAEVPILHSEDAAILHAATSPRAKELSGRILKIRLAGANRPRMDLQVMLECLRDLSQVERESVSAEVEAVLKKPYWRLLQAEIGGLAQPVVQRAFGCPVGLCLAMLLHRISRVSPVVSNRIVLVLRAAVALRSKDLLKREDLLAGLQEAFPRPVTQGARSFRQKRRTTTPDQPNQSSSDEVVDYCLGRLGVEEGALEEVQRLFGIVLDTFLKGEIESPLDVLAACDEFPELQALLSLYAAPGECRCINQTEDPLLDRVLEALNHASL